MASLREIKPAQGIFAFNLVLVDVLTICLTFSSTYLTIKYRRDHARLLPQRSEAGSTSRLIFFSAVVYMTSSTAFNVIKTVCDVRHALYAKSEILDRNLNSVLIVAFLVQSYLLLIAVSSRLSIRFQNNQMSSRRSVLKLSLLMVPLLIFCVVGAAPALGASPLIQQSCKIGLLLPIILSIVALYVRAMVQTTPRLSMLNDPLPPLAGPPLPGLTMTMTTEETRSEPAPTPLVMDTDQMVMRRFVKQITWMVVAVVATLGIEIVMTMVAFRQEELMDSPWMVMTSSLSLSIHSVVTFRSIASSYAFKLCLCRVPCPCRSHRETVSDRVDDQAAVKAGDQEEMYHIDYPSRTAVSNGDKGEGEGIQIAVTHTANHSAKNAKNAKMVTNLAYDDVFGRKDHSMISPSLDASRHHHEPMSVDLYDFDSRSSDAVPPKRVRSIDSRMFTFSSSSSSDHYCSPGGIRNLEY